RALAVRSGRGGIAAARRADLRDQRRRLLVAGRPPGAAPRRPGGGSRGAPALPRPRSQRRSGARNRTGPPADGREGELGAGTVKARRDRLSAGVVRPRGETSGRVSPVLRAGPPVPKMTGD